MALKVDIEENFTLQHTYLRDKIWDIYVKLSASMNVKFGICRRVVVQVFIGVDTSKMLTQW
jgi:hypothetical protein